MEDIKTVELNLKDFTEIPPPCGSALPKSSENKGSCPVLASLPPLPSGMGREERILAERGKARCGIFP